MFVLLDLCLVIFSGLQASAKGPQPTYLHPALPSAALPIICFCPCYLRSLLPAVLWLTSSSVVL